ncbi:glutaredoxin [Thalassotalea sp. HSM 43]|uniref:glutaredoxin family protein n=1 Tax=Thalassotalea sp. HSM 43 TaxID=2552945 RepID=UPI00108137B2|nr:glutaredoxin [Thalassotalea sp. HSM 43]QBY05248.1 glutaredoxin [Thalassotalea sp. HSM 43]
MAVIRFILGRLILLFNFIFSPKSVQRDSDSQQKLDQTTDSFSLYQLNACPFCVKVRRAMKRQGLNIKLVDIKQDDNLQHLIESGGKRTVPCLRIDNQDGSSQWMYESSAIIKYLDDVAAKAA